MNKEIEIPEGYEARIEGNKVIFVQNESEDERIRKYIVKFVELEKGVNLPPDDADKMLAYLEKQKEQQPAEWSEEDEKLLNKVEALLDDYCDYLVDESSRFIPEVRETISRLKSLRPQPKQEDEPMKIKFAGNIYKVHSKKDMPGGVIGYIIEDEPGHYDCITNPEEVLGGGYGVKETGSPYPTKNAKFKQPHWKPSEEQMCELNWASKLSPVLESLYSDLKKLM